MQGMNRGHGIRGANGDVNCREDDEKFVMFDQAIGCGNPSSR